MTLEESYHILRVRPSSPLRIIHKAYKKKALRYHPSLPHTRNYTQRFINVYIAYRLTVYVRENQKIHKDTRENLVQFWNDHIMVEDIITAEYLARLKREVFERYIFTGFNKIIKITYGLFILLLSFAISYPVKCYFRQELSLMATLVFVICLAAPIGFLIMKLIKEENSIAKRIAKIESGKEIRIIDKKDNDSNNSENRINMQKLP